MQTAAPSSEPTPAPDPAQGPDRKRRPLGATLRATAGILILVIGASVLADTAWMLWGTGLHERAEQAALGEEFAEILADIGVDPEALEALPGEEPDREPVVFARTGPAPAYGSAVGKIDVPSIGVHRHIVEGSDWNQLKRGVAHVEGTPLPGQYGNAVVTGHRTTYGQPFHNIDKMQVGDTFTFTTVQGRFTYEMTDMFIVPEDAVEVMDDHGDNRLTVISCHPKYSRRERIIAIGELVGEPVERLPEQVLEPARAEGVVEAFGSDELDLAASVVAALVIAAAAALLGGIYTRVVLAMSEGTPRSGMLPIHPAWVVAAVGLAGIALRIHLGA